MPGESLIRLVVMAFAMSFAVIAAMIVLAMIPILAGATLVTTLPMLFLVARHVLAVVPVVLHKIDTLAAGIVLMTVPAPVFGVAGRYAQIDRWAIR